MVDWRYRGVPAFVCMNAVYGSVIRLIGDAIVLTALQQRPSTATQTSWRPQNYGESTEIGVERQKQRAIFVTSCQRRRRLQYTFHGQFLEHFFPFSFVLSTFFECLSNRAARANNFRPIMTQSNMIQTRSNLHLLTRFPLPSFLFPTITVLVSCRVSTRPSARRR